MKARILVIISLLSLLSISCEKDFKRSYPIIKIIPPSDITTLGATFSATIDHVPGQPVLDYGFSWTDSRGTTSISLGPTTATRVSYQARSGFRAGETKVKAYLATNDYKFYGEEIVFTSEGSEGAVITSVSPNPVKPLDTVTVFGRNFVTSTMSIWTESKYVGLTFQTNHEGTSAKFVVPFTLTTPQKFILDINGQKEAFPAELNIVLPYWKKLADFPGQARTNAFSFSLNGKGYVGTGTGTGGLLNDFWQYDPVLDQWTQLANFPGGARANASVFVVDDKAYVGLGEGGPYWNNSHSDLWMYDPVANSWTSKADYPGGQRWGSLAFGLNGKGYFGGGKNYQGIDALDFWEYDPQTNAWTQQPNIPRAIVKSRAPGYTLNGKINYFSVVGTFYSFANGTWTPDISPQRVVESGYAVMMFQDRVLLLGTNNLEITGPIGSLRNFPVNESDRMGGISFVINGKGYYGMGLKGTSIMLKDMMEFDPSKL